MFGMAMMMGADQRVLPGCSLHSFHGRGFPEKVFENV